MPTARDPDPRLTLAFELLQSALAEADAPSVWAGNTAQLPFVPPSLNADERLSATDLLGWWFRPYPGGKDPWEDYFDQSLRVTTPPISTSAEQPRQQPTARYHAEQALPPPAAEPAGPWADLWELATEPEEEIAHAHAEAAVECLYAFVHAIGRRDVNAAMEYIAEDYHTMEDDREIDRLALRHQIEALLDSLRGWELEIAPAEIPIPIFHPNGILIYTEIQIEAYEPQALLRHSSVERRVAVFAQRGSDDWVIAALSRV